MSHIRTVATAITLLFAFGLTVPASADPVPPSGTKKQDKDAKKFNKETEKAEKKAEKEKRKAEKKAEKDEKKDDKKDDKKK